MTGRPRTRAAAPALGKVSENHGVACGSEGRFLTARRSRIWACTATWLASRASWNLVQDGCVQRDGPEGGFQTTRSKQSVTGGFRCALCRSCLLIKDTWKEKKNERRNDNLTDIVILTEFSADVGFPCRTTSNGLVSLHIYYPAPHDPQIFKGQEFMVNFGTHESCRAPVAQKRG